MNCASCIHFLPAGALSNAPKSSGNCHRYPPQMIMAPVPAPGKGMMMVPAVAFPQVHEDAHCGEWSAKVVA